MHRRKHVSFKNVQAKPKAKPKTVEETDDVPELVGLNEERSQEKYLEEDEDDEDDEEDDDDNEDEAYEITEDSTEVVPPEQWKMMWVKFLMDLREDELLFTAFQSSIERTQETINPLMLAASQQMAVNMLDRLLMESQLSLDKPSPGINEDQIAAMKQLLATYIKKHSEDAEEEEEENKPELPSEEDSLEKRAKNAVEWGIPIREIKIGTWEAQRAWTHQFLLKADPIKKEIQINMFKFMADEMPSILKKVMYMGPTTGLMAYFAKQLNRFEVSRQLQIPIPFDAISGVHYFRSSKESDYGMIVFHLDHPAAFRTRRLNCSASLKNEFKHRDDFTKDQSASSYSRIFISGDHDDFLNFLSILFAVDEKFKVLVNKGLDDIGDDSFQFSEESKQKLPKREEPKTEDRDVPKEILDQLVSKGLLVSSTADIATLPKHFCFQDYIKYKCETAEELEKVLQLEVTCDCGASTDMMNYVQHGCANNCKNTLYSFCHGSMLHEDRGGHCKKCHMCFDQHYWHCENCNRCSFGRSIGHCEWCGSHGNDGNMFSGIKKKTKPQPLSLHLNSLMHGEEPSQVDTALFSDVESEADTPEWTGWTAGQLTQEVMQNAEEEMMYNEMGADGTFDIPPGFSPFGMPGMPFSMPPGFGQDAEEEVMMNAFANAFSSMGMARDMFGPDDDEEDEEDEDGFEDMYAEDDEDDDQPQPRLTLIDVNAEHDEPADYELHEEDGSVHRRRRTGRQPQPGPRVMHGNPQVGCAQQ